MTLGAIASGDNVECSWSYVLSWFVDKSRAQQAKSAHGSVWRPKNEFEVAWAYRLWIPIVSSDRGVALVLILRRFLTQKNWDGFFTSAGHQHVTAHPVWGAGSDYTAEDSGLLASCFLLFSNQDWLLDPWVESTHVASDTGVHQFLILQWFPWGFTAEPGS